ncbi:zeta toxin family protein [Spirosoma aerophilum]
MSIASRPLKNNIAVEEFFQISLGYDYAKDSKLKKKKTIIGKIIDGEMGVAAVADEELQTLSNDRRRAQPYRTDPDRWILRDRIIHELLSEKRLDKDDRIRLGKGGALPSGELKYEAKAFFIIGLPASGKSGIANHVADEFGAIILDSDYAKRKLPEYRNHDYGASLVHEESKEIIFQFTVPNPDKIESAFTRCAEQDMNLVIPIVGSNPERVIEMAQDLKDLDYTIHLILVFVSRKEATIRATRRFAETDRYVPLGLIFDVFGNDPSHCYYYLRCKHKDLFASFGIVSTMGLSPQCTDSEKDTPARNYPENNAILRLP